MNRIGLSSQVSEDHSPIGNVQGSPSDMVAIGDVRVPSGFLLQWGTDLGWPAWLMAGCSRAVRAPLSNLIPLRDDIVIMANLVNRVGPAALLKSILCDDHIRLPSSGYSVAPDGRELVRIVAKAVNVQNPHLQVLVAETDDGVVLNCHCSLPAGSLGRFFEAAVAIVVARSVTHCNPTLSRFGDEIEAKVQVRLRKIDGLNLADVPSQEPIEIVWADECGANDGATAVILPESVLNRPNPRHDAEAWRAIQLRLRRIWMDDPSPLSLISLRLHIRQVLQNRQRPPDLHEVSRDLQISKRTMNRKLASMGMGFQSLVTTERMFAAQERLARRDWSVEMVAQAVGYSTAASFGRAFRQHCGVPPAAWRAATGSTGSDRGQTTPPPSQAATDTATAFSHEMEASV